MDQNSLYPQLFNPSKINHMYWVYCREDYLMNKYPNNDGKWMMFFPIEEVDARWAEACGLYRSGKLKGINSMKVSTAKPNSQRIYDEGEAIIIFYCGPSEDKVNVIEYGRNILSYMNYPRDTFYYKSDQPHLINWNNRYRHMYTINTRESFSNRNSRISNHYNSNRNKAIFYQNQGYSGLSGGQRPHSAYTPPSPIPARSSSAVPYYQNPSLNASSPNKIHTPSRSSSTSPYYQSNSSLYPSSQSQSPSPTPSGYQTRSSSAVPFYQNQVSINQSSPSPYQNSPLPRSSSAVPFYQNQASINQTSPSPYQTSPSPYQTSPSPRSASAVPFYHNLLDSSSTSNKHHAPSSVQSRSISASPYSGSVYDSISERSHHRSSTPSTRSSWDSYDNSISYNNQYGSSYDNSYAQDNLRSQINQSSYGGNDTSDYSLGFNNFNNGYPSSLGNYGNAYGAGLGGNDFGSGNMYGDSFNNNNMGLGNSYGNGYGIGLGGYY